MLAFGARAGLVLAVGGALAVVGIFACGGEENANEPTFRGPIGQDPEPLFRALEDDLVASCGGANGTCHERGSFQRAPTWLGGPDRYASVKKYRGMIPATKEPGDSLLLTQVRHAGPALKDAPNDLYRRVADWLLAEVPPPPLPNTGAFTVATGFNSINLDTLADGLTGARLTFLAVEANGVLTLSTLRLTAPQNANVTVDSPFFVILPRNGKVNADPEVNGFKGELTIPAGQTVDLYTGKMILLRWDPTGALKIVFQKVTTTPGEGSARGCTALELFQSSALPAMRMPVDVVAVDNGEDQGPDAAAPGTVIGKGSCLGCHATTPPANVGTTTAVQAMDLRAVDTDPAAACAQARNWITFQDKTQSPILLNPVGAINPQHPMKAVSDTDPIVQGIRAWVEAEQER